VKLSHRDGEPLRKSHVHLSVGARMRSVESNPPAEGRQSGVTRETASTSELLAFERMLSELSARFTNIPIEHVENEIELAQTFLWKFLGFDRSTFAEFQQDGSLVVLSSSSAEGFDSTPLGQLPPQLAWFIGQLRAGEVVVIPNAAVDFPPEAGFETDYCRRTGLISLLTIPLRIGGRVTGVISFSAYRETRVWPDDLIARLKIVGEIFINALARKRDQEKLLSAMAEIKALKDRLERENTYLQRAVHSRLSGTLTSRSPSFLSVINDVAQVAPTSSTVLLLGETGSGKEVLAQAVHDASARKARSMLKVNCAALPASLIESELFGREKGAYTGALARQPGRFEIADGSTIFLDEVGELPLELQPKLLRVLQDGEFQRLGGTKTIKVDARVIAATNRALEQAVKEGKFREDLYYRLNVFPIEVPPLRRRREDIPLLAWTFVNEFSNSMSKPIDEISEESMAALLDYQWPGNIRELRNLVERAMILTQGPKLHIKLGQSTLRVASMQATAGSLDAAERAIILNALEQCGWRIRGSNGAAVLLDVKPTTLEARVKKLGLQQKP
jgi:formate hydrogenlyase transcriptional activator